MLRDSKGKFIKGNKGFWLNKKRPGLLTPTSFKKGLIPWNKGHIKVFTCIGCNQKFTPSQCKTYQQYCSLQCFGDHKPHNHPNCLSCEKLLRWGRKCCQKCRVRELSPNYRGGKTKCLAWVFV